MLQTIRDISEDQIIKLLDFIENSHHTDSQRLKAIRNKTMILLMLDAGLRVGEVSKMHRGALCVANHFVNDVVVTADSSKSKRERRVPMTLRLKASIFTMSESIWVPFAIPLEYPAFASSHYHENITTRQIERIVGSASLAAFGKWIHPHQLRHTFATRLMRTTSIRIVQELLGHKNLSSTQIYTHPNGQDLSKAIEGLNNQKGKP